MTKEVTFKCSKYSGFGDVFRCGNPECNQVLFKSNDIVSNVVFTDPSK